MSAPSSFHNSPHDGRAEVETLDAVEVDDLVTVDRRGGVVFPARYVSGCAGCPVQITPGDPITRGVDGLAEHAECPDELEVPKQGVCDECGLVRTPAGKCSGWCE